MGMPGSETALEELLCRVLGELLEEGVDLLDLRAFLGFDSWQSANKGIPLGSVKYHLGSIGGVDATSMEVVFDVISPSSCGATY